MNTNRRIVSINMAVLAEIMAGDHYMPSRDKRRRQPERLCFHCKEKPRTKDSGWCSPECKRAYIETREADSAS